MHRLKLFFFWSFLLLTVGAGAAPEYRQTLAGHEFTPANLGSRCLFSGKGLQGKLTAGEQSSVWEILPGEGELDRWAALGIEFVNPRTVPPVGFRLEIDLSQPVKAGFEPRINRTPGKGFWDTQWLGRRSVELPAGRQVLEYTWGDLGVKSADWSRVNAVSMALGIPVKVELISFGLLYPEPAAAGVGRTVNFIDAKAGETNPVARPFDKLSGVHAYRAGEGLKSTRDVGELPDFGQTAVWQVKGDPAVRSWAVFGFGLIDLPDPPLAGLRFEVFLPEDTELGIQLLKGFDREKGFYVAKKSGAAKKVRLTAGRQFVDLDWAAFGVPETDRNFINSVEFIADRAMEMHILKVDFVFPDETAAAAYRTVRDSKLKLLHRTLISALAARGVKWTESLAPKNPEEIEPLLWAGIQLSAQREQLDYWKTLYEPSTAVALGKRRDELVAAGVRGEFSSLRKMAGELQKEIDSYIDRALAAVPLEKRRFSYDPDQRRFRYPDGAPYRMYGPHFFRALYGAGPLSSWRPWDMRYLAGLGFNGIRLHVMWGSLEPRQGSFDSENLEKFRTICREAERYGFGVSFDLHWPYPDWFNQGRPGFEHGGKLARANSYHWPEALTDSWRRIGSAFADVPNIVAFELPTNETPIGNDKNGLMASPYLMMRWNEFLKKEYGSREQLQAVWGAAANGAGRYGLAVEENWENNSIRPLGFQNDSSADQAYESSPRFYDHLRFAAMMQKELSGTILKELRKSIPGAQGMFQRTIGDMWDSSPVPVNYHAIMTCVDPAVLPGTHYNMGGVQARKAAVLSMGSFDSEQQMEGSRGAVERHVALGLGFCPFTFHFRGGGGMLLADDDWHLKPEVGYLPLMADHIRNFWPAPKTGTRVAVIVNSRLEAAAGAKLGDLIAGLEKRGCNAGVFESMRVVDEPELLKGYALAVTSSSYIDLALLDLLREKFDGRVLLHGRLDMDAYARKAQEGLPGYLTRKKLFLKTAAVRRAAELSGQIDLAGSWEFQFLGKNEKPVASAPADWKNTEEMKVPGMWGESGMTGSLRYRIGDGAYRKKVVVPADWNGRPLRLKLGAIDDLDWVFWNGRLIGHTGEKTPNYWMASREYAIPADGTRFGQENELVIVVRNLRDDGGIWKAPVEITGSSAGSLILTDGKTLPVPCGSTTTLVVPEILTDSTEILARFRLPDGKNESIAFIRQGRIFWYFNDQELNTETSAADAQVLQTVLSDL